MLVQLDLIDTRLLPDHRAHVYADDQGDEDRTPLGDLLSPLVVEPDGTLVPLGYGFPRYFTLGNLHEATLSELGQRWRRQRLPEFRQVCKRVYEELSQSTSLPFSNWYEAVGQEAQAAVERSRSRQRLGRAASSSPVLPV
jgi:hypothetical protein